mgnify:FL=1
MLLPLADDRCADVRETDTLHARSSSRLAASLRCDKSSSSTFTPRTLAKLL